VSATITLTQGRVAIVDEADHEWLSQWKWCATTRGRNGELVAIRNVWERGQHSMILMHRALLDAPEGMLVDHINHDPLDNRRSNLRLCTQTENLANQRKTRGSSAFKGVYWDRSRQAWAAQIGRHGTPGAFLGRFASELDAAEAYDAAAAERWGEFALLNFSEQVRP